jgi:hypothetical protein
VSRFVWVVCSNNGGFQDKASLSFSTGLWQLHDDVATSNRAPMCEEEWVCPPGFYCSPSAWKVSAPEGFSA